MRKKVESQPNLERKENEILLELSNSNDNSKRISAYHRLGILFSKSDIDKSIGYFVEAAKLGSAEDMFNCGYFLIQKSSMIDKDSKDIIQKLRKRAKLFYRKATEKDYKKAIANYYNLCDEDEEEEDARFFIRTNADNGNTNSMIFYARLLEKNKKGSKNSLNYYKMAADHCRKNEAMIYADKIVETNLKEAIIYYKVSISKGSIKACFALAKIFKANKQIDTAIEYYKIALLLIDRQKAEKKLKEKDIQNEIKACYKIGKFYYKKYQERSSLQFLKLSEFYLMKIFKESQKASQILFQVIELQKEELSHQEYIDLMKSLGLSGASGAVKIYFNETNDIEYIKQAISNNPDDPFTNYIFGTIENKIEFIQKAAEQGSPEASYDYAIHLYSQTDTNESKQRLDETFRLLNYAYENGVTKAALILGILYHNNWVDSEDGDNEEKALELLEKVKDEDERASFLVKEIKTKQIQKRNNSKYSVFL